MSEAALPPLPLEGRAIAYESFSPASPEPPPLTPPLKGEGDSEASAPPSPLRGGVRGGGSIKDSRIHMRLLSPQGEGKWQTGGARGI